MAAPDFVPVDPNQKLRAYTSPPLRPGSWTGGRAGEVEGPPPKGPGLGTAGPDQGYAFRLVRHLEDRLHLGAVKKADAVAGCVALAMKRSGLYGRAPVIHDLTSAFTIYGFLDSNPPTELVALREPLFAEVQSAHHYFERRQVVDLVPDEVLMLSHTAVDDAYRSNWRDLLDTSQLGHHS